jgi:hypothetical protein
LLLTILLFNPVTRESDIVALPRSAVIVSLAATTVKIAVASEDDICVFSHFPAEPNLIRQTGDDDFFEELEEKKEREGWLAQPTHLQSRAASAPTRNIDTASSKSLCA